MGLTVTEHSRWLGGLQTTDFFMSGSRYVKLDSTTVGKFTRITTSRLVKDSFGVKTQWELLT